MSAYIYCTDERGVSYTVPGTEAMKPHKATTLASWLSSVFPHRQFIAVEDTGGTQ